jgi:uncharacterized protein YkwD
MVFWIFIHTCTIAFFSVFLAGLAVSGVILNDLLYVIIMGLGITTVAKIIRSKTRKKQFIINTEFFVWVCISAFSFWFSRVFLASLFDVQTGILYFVLMGCGVYISSLIFSKISILKISTFKQKYPHSINPKIRTKYGKNIKIENEIFNYVNQERKKRHIHPLMWNDSLYSLAQRRAKEITWDFSHKNVPMGCGENIAMVPLGRVRGLGFIDRKNIARSFIRTWMKSTGHRENILRSNYSSFSVGVTTKGKYYYGVQLFS